MKISMWMIANQLEDLNAEFNITETSDVRYKSVRLRSSESCLLLQEAGRDVLIVGAGDDNYIRLKEMTIIDALELVQNIFDLYTDWDEMLHQAIQDFDYKQMVDCSWAIFRSPLTLLDSNYKVLAMSSQVDRNINPEWQHLYEYGYKSVNNYNRFREVFKKQETSPARRPLYIVDPPTSDKANFLTDIIRYNNILYGRFTVLEYGRKLTEGDFQNAQHICNVIAKNMFKLDREDKKASTYSNILKIIQGESVSPEAISRFLSYMNWEKEDNYRIGVVMLEDNTAAESTMPLIQEYLRSYLPLCPSFIIDDTIVLLFNESHHLYQDYLNGIKKTYLFRLGTLFGASLQFSALTRLNQYVKQAIYAVKTGHRKYPNTRFFNFYKYALNYILESASTEEKLCACHPDVVELWRNEPAAANQALLTLCKFLSCERSLLKASKELFIHRNTLLYRVKQIERDMAYDLDDAYTREYILISIRVISILSSTKEMPVGLFNINE